MRALGYLLITRIKNRLISMVKNPGSLIGLVVMVALLGFVVYSGHMSEEGPVEVLRSMYELYALALLLFGAMFLLMAKNGLGKGTSLFTMQDVNLLFTSPISSARILIYGLVQQMGTSLLMGFFLLYQYSWMHNVYGVGAGFMVALVLGYGITVFCGQLTAMVIYAFTSGHDGRKRAVMWTMVGVTALAVGYVLLAMYRQQDNLLGAAVTASTGMPLSLFPVAGWLRAFVVGIDQGSWLPVLAGLAAVAAYVALLTRAVTSSRADYYEDVLQATESSYTAVLSAKEGKVVEALPKNIKTGKIGLNRGWGGSAFFYKHLLEGRRARRFILDPMSLIMMVVTLVFAFFMREFGLMPVLFLSIYLQFFVSSTGRWVRELLYPYVYMVPEKPFRKLMWCLMQTFYSQAVEAVIMSVGLMLVMNLSVADTVAFVIMRFSFAVLFIAGMLLVERLFTGLRLKWLVLIIMIIVMLLLMAPGIALAIVTGIYLPDFLTANLRMLLSMAVPNFLVALLAIFASRNVLRTAELNSPA